MIRILGLGSILLWQWLTVLEGSFFSSLPGTSFLEPNMKYAFFSLVLCMTFFSLARWGKNLPERWFARGMWGAGVVMSMAWLPWGAWVREIPFLGLPLFLGLPAVGSAIQLAGWEWYLSGSSFSLQALSFGSACLFRTLLIFLISFFPSGLIPVAVILPFLGALLWIPPNASNVSSQLQDEHPSWKREKLTFPPRLVFRVVSFFGVSAMFLSIVLVRHNEAMALAQKMTDPLYSLGALGMGILLYYFPSLDLRSMYTWAQTFVGLGFLVFAALGEGRPFLPLALLQLGFGIFGAYIFTLLLYLGSRGGRKKALSVVATGQMVITGSVFLGLLLTRIMGLVAFQAKVPFVLTCSLLGVGLLFFSGFFFRDHQENFAGYDLDEREDLTVPEGEDLWHFQLLKEGLSLQEVKVAVLVARGLSNGEISLDLNITGNTLRSHLKKIHKKMGSANREALREELLRRENMVWKGISSGE